MQTPMPRPAFGLSPALARSHAQPKSSWASCSNLRLARPPPPRAVQTAPRATVTPPGPPGKADGGLTNLNELTERISDLLNTGSIQRGRATPSPSADDLRLAHLDASTHVVVVFGKRLIRDQVSVEYAKRVVTLVKQLATGALNPDIICFTGGVAPAGCVSEAAAGYAFFRSVCEESGVDVSAYDYMLEEKSATTAQNVKGVIAGLQQRLDPGAVARCHFTLVSSDYHLIRLQEVHRLSVNSDESALFPLQLFGATWSFLFAAYPFCVSRDAATAFLGRAVVLANDLGVVLVNVNAAVASRQFIAQENLARLRETFAKMRDMYRVIDSRAASGFRTDMRRHAETLELAIHRVREVATALSPLSVDGEAVPGDDLKLAQRLLMAAVRDIRESMDPDRVLLVADRVAVVEDMASYAAKARGKRAAGEDDPAKDARQTDPASKVAAHLLPKQRRARRAAPDYASSELAGHSGATFAGNGKRIAREGPNVVVLDEHAEEAAAAGEEAQTTAVQAPRGVSATARAAAAAVTGPLRRTRTAAAQRRAATAPGATRKRRSTVAAKTKAATTAKRKSSSRKTAADIDGVSQLLQ